MGWLYVGGNPKLTVCLSVCRPFTRYLASSCSPVLLTDPNLQPTAEITALCNSSEGLQGAFPVCDLSATEQRACCESDSDLVSRAGSSVCVNALDSSAPVSPSPSDTGSSVQKECTLATCLLASVSSLSLTFQSSREGITQATVRDPQLPSPLTPEGVAQFETVLQTVPRSSHHPETEPTGSGISPRNATADTSRLEDPTHATSSPDIKEETYTGNDQGIVCKIPDPETNSAPDPVHSSPVIEANLDSETPSHSPGHHSPTLTAQSSPQTPSILRNQHGGYSSEASVFTDEQEEDNEGGNTNPSPTSTESDNSSYSSPWRRTTPKTEDIIFISSDSGSEDKSPRNHDPGAPVASLAGLDNESTGKSSRKVGLNVCDKSSPYPADIGPNESPQPSPIADPCGGSEASGSTISGIYPLPCSDNTSKQSSASQSSTGASLIVVQTQHQFTQYPSPFPQKGPKRGTSSSEKASSAQSHKGRPLSSTSSIPPSSSTESRSRPGNVSKKQRGRKPKRTTRKFSLPGDRKPLSMLPTSAPCGPAPVQPSQFLNEEIVFRVPGCNLRISIKPDFPCRTTSLPIPQQLMVSLGSTQSEQREDNNLPTTQTTPITEPTTPEQDATATGATCSNVARHNPAEQQPEFSNSDDQSQGELASPASQVAPQTLREVNLQDPGNVPQKHPQPSQSPDHLEDYSGTNSSPGVSPHSQQPGQHDESYYDTPGATADAEEARSPTPQKDREQEDRQCQENTGATIVDHPGDCGNISTSQEGDVSTEDRGPEDGESADPPPGEGNVQMVDHCSSPATIFDNYVSLADILNPGSPVQSKTSSIGSPSPCCSPRNLSPRTSPTTQTAATDHLTQMSAQMQLTTSPEPRLCLPEDPGSDCQTLGVESGEEGPVVAVEGDSTKSNPESPSQIQTSEHETQNIVETGEEGRTSDTNQGRTSRPDTPQETRENSVGKKAKKKKKHTRPTSPIDDTSQREEGDDLDQKNKSRRKYQQASAESSDDQGGIPHKKKQKKSRRETDDGAGPSHRSGEAGDVETQANQPDNFYCPENIPVKSRPIHAFIQEFLGDLVDYCTGQPRYGVLFVTNFLSTANRICKGIQFPGIRAGKPSLMPIFGGPNQTKSYSLQIFCFTRSQAYALTTGIQMYFRKGRFQETPFVTPIKLKFPIPVSIDAPDEESD